MKSDEAWKILERSPKVNELFKPYSISNRESNNEVTSIEIDGSELSVVRSKAGLERVISIQAREF